MSNKVDVRKEHPRTTLHNTAEHYTTFGDVIMAVIKDLHISEARAKVPANNVRILSHPFEVEPETLGMLRLTVKQGNERLWLMLVRWEIRLKSVCTGSFFTL